MASSFELTNENGKVLSISSGSITENKVLESSDFKYIRDTISSLSSISNPLDGDVCFIKSYHTNSDNAGGKFIYRANMSKSKHNGGTIIDPSKSFPSDWNDTTQVTDWFTADSSGNGCWERVYDGAVNVKWFGAVNDSTIDSSIAFLKATELRNIIVNDTIYIKNVLINNEVFINGNAVAGPMASNLNGVIKAFDDADYLIKIEGNNTTLSGSSILNVKLDGNNKNINLFESNNVSNLRIDKVSFNNVNGKAINLQKTMESIVTQCYFRKCGTLDGSVIYIDKYVNNDPAQNVNNLHIIDNTFGYNSGNWIESDSLSNIDILWIKDNKFEFDGIYNQNQSSCSTIKLNDISRCWIIDNSFTWFTDSNNNYDSCITLDRKGLSSMPDVKISGNKLLNCDGFINNIGSKITAHNNTAYGIHSSIINTSSYAQNIEDIVYMQTNGNIANLKLKNNKYISAHLTQSPMKLDFVIDNDSLFLTKTAKQATAKNDILAYISVGEYISAPDYRLKIGLRLKADSSANVEVYLDDNSLGTQTITTAYQDYYWFPLINNITQNSVIKVYSQSDVNVYFDAYFIEDYPDFSGFTWEVDSLGNGDVVNSPTQGLNCNPTDYVYFTSSVNLQGVTANIQKEANKCILTLINNTGNSVNLGTGRYVIYSSKKSFH